LLAGRRGSTADLQSKQYAKKISLLEMPAATGGCLGESTVGMRPAQARGVPRNRREQP